MISDIRHIVVYLGLAVALLSLEDHPGSRICNADVDHQRWEAGLRSCSAELARTGDPGFALEAAKSALYLGRYDDVIPPATAALDGPDAADACTLLGAAIFRQGYATDGDAATQRRLYTAAQAHLQAGLVLHALAGDDHGVVSDAQQLASLWREIGDYQAALANAALAREIASRTRRASLSIAADIAMADIYRGIGRNREAEAILGAIDERSLDAYHRPWVLVKRALVHLEAEAWQLARDPLTRALAEERAARSPRPDLLEAALLNLSFVERKARAFEKALDYLEQARAIATGPMEYHLNRGKTLADAGRLEEAAAELDAAEAAGPTGQWGPDVAYQRALVAIRRGDRATAMACLRRAIERVNVLARGSASWVPTMIAQNREPHLALIELHAEAEGWDEIIDVIAGLDAQALLASTAAATDLGPSSVDPPQSAPAPRPVARASAKEIVEAWRGRRLIVVVPGGTRVWRLDVADGAVRGSDVGSRAELADLALRLESQPLDAEAGGRLGEAILLGHGPDGGRPVPEGERIELLAIGPIARAPLAALRAGGAAAQARWQLVRVPGILPRLRTGRRDAGQRDARKTVLVADPRPKGAGWALPAARDQAIRVAEALHGTAAVGAAASRAALLGALDARWLQIATRTVWTVDGAALVLHDGEVGAREIVERGGAPEVVVLASCDTAVGEDDAGNGSLANAFLDAGAETVVATRWLIEDAEASAAVDAFYGRGAARDPIAALRAMQLDPPAGVPARAWSAFEASLARPDRPATAP